MQKRKVCVLLAVFVLIASTMAFGSTAGIAHDVSDTVSEQSNQRVLAEDSSYYILHKELQEHLDNIAGIQLDNGAYASMCGELSHYIDTICASASDLQVNSLFNACTRYFSIASKELSFSIENYNSYVALLKALLAYSDNLANATTSPNYFTVVKMYGALADYFRTMRNMELGSNSYASVYAVLEDYIERIPLLKLDGLRSREVYRAIYSIIEPYFSCVPASEKANMVMGTGLKFYLEYLTSDAFRPDLEIATYNAFIHYIGSVQANLNHEDMHAYMFEAFKLICENLSKCSSSNPPDLSLENALSYFLHCLSEYRPSIDSCTAMLDALKTYYENVIRATQNGMGDFDDYMAYEFKYMIRSIISPDEE